jgi:hypothetical protein
VRALNAVQFFLPDRISIFPFAGAEAERSALVSAAVDGGGVGQVGGSGALRLIQLVRGEGDEDQSRSFESIVGNACSGAVSAAVSSINIQALLPHPSAAVYEFFQNFGPLYVFHKGFAYRALSEGWSPYEEGKCTQEGQSLPLPPDHEIAPDEQESKEVRVGMSCTTIQHLSLSGLGHCSVSLEHTRYGCQERRWLLHGKFRHRTHVWSKVG